MNIKNEIDQRFRDKILLLTGGTGSFGNAVLREFLSTSIREIRIFSRDEKKQEDMRVSFNNKKLKFFVGDVRDYDSIYQAMSGVDYVFHAAALKQVPSCEFYPLEAVKTNIIGSENVMAAAISQKVAKVVMLSTDKAVFPINAMGMTKGVMERLMIAKSRTQSKNGTILCATRYGNVLGSRGSVVPLFISQIKSGKSLTLTDPYMTRFLMSLDDSVSLVLHAFLNGINGDIFVQKSSASTMDVMARALKELFKADNPIQVIGTRHGEKLYETLVSREEMARADDSDDYYRIPADNRDLNYEEFFTQGKQEISNKNDYTSSNTKILDLIEVKKLLLDLEFIRSELRLRDKE